MAECYCRGGPPSRTVQAPLIPSDLPALRRSLAVSVLVHVALGAFAWVLFKPAPRVETELVDIEVAPPPPEVEALPPEVARVPEAPTPGSVDPASTAPPQPGDEGYTVDAGVDAPVDAAIDAPTDAAPKKKKPKPDAAVDAAEPMVAEADAGVDDAGTDDATTVVAGAEGSGEGSAAGSGSGVG